MSDFAIKVEGLSKAYLVGHQRADSAGYQTLREAMGRAARQFTRKAIDMARGRQIIQGDEIEEFWALKNVSFEVGRGEVVGIIGRNGAGKSTLLKILSRITEPSRGRVRIRGRVASLLEVGTGFHPELTGRENIFLNGAILGMTRREIDRKFDEIVQFAEVENFLDTPVKRYSSGMYVRLAFAVAAHLEQEILVVDEVLAVGDTEFQRKCLGKMSEVAVGGRTVLFVSHNMAAVENLCQKCLVLERGKVSSYSSALEGLNDYMKSLSPGPGQETGHIWRPAWARKLIRRVTVMDKDGMPRSNFRMGESIAIEITFECDGGEPLRRPVMGVILNHVLRGAVGGVNTRMTGFNPQGGPYANGVYRCVLQFPPLLEGSYTLDVWLGDGQEDVDTVAQASSLLIEESDIYNTGNTPLKNLGIIYLNPAWSLNAMPSAGRDLLV